MVIFDLDGTLWDSAESVAESWNIVIRNTGYAGKKLKASDIRRNMGKTMNEIADELMNWLPEKERYELARACEIYENEYITEHGGTLFPGVRETISELMHRGIKMAIVSNCQEGYVKAFLDSMDMQDIFTDYEEWGRSGLLKADNIRLVMERNHAGEAVYIGDIQKDADASREAGVPCIWAEYGFGQIKEPAGILHKFEDLPEVLSEIGYLQKQIAVKGIITYEA